MLHVVVVGMCIPRARSVLNHLPVLFVRLFLYSRTNSTFRPDEPLYIPISPTSVDLGPRLPQPAGVLHDERIELKGLQQLPGLLLPQETRVHPLVRTKPKVVLSPKP